MRIARALPRARNASVRMAVANLHRPGALTSSLVLSLGIGITLLVTIAAIDGSLTQEIRRTLPVQWNLALTRPYLSVWISSPCGPTTIAVCGPWMRGLAVLRMVRKGWSAETAVKLHA